MEKAELKWKAWGWAARGGHLGRQAVSQAPGLRRHGRSFTGRSDVPPNRLTAPVICIHCNTQEDKQNVVLGPKEQKI